MEAGGFEPPSRSFHKSLCEPYLGFNVFSYKGLKLFPALIRLNHVSSEFITSNTPVLLPRKTTQVSNQSVLFSHLSKFLLAVMEYGQP